MLLAIRSLLCALLLLAGGCALAAGPDAASTEWGFSVRASSRRLVLTNASDLRVHYVALEEKAAALVDLDPDHTRWPAVEPGAHVRIPLSELSGYDRGDRWTRVFWATREAQGHLRVELR